MIYIITFDLCICQKHKYSRQYFSEKMTTHSTSVINNYNVFREHQNEGNKELKGRNLSSVKCIWYSRECLDLDYCIRILCISIGKT